MGLTQRPSNCRRCEVVAAGSAHATWGSWQTRKSVCAECNWGIRIHRVEDVRSYLQEILAEVLHRMSFLRLKGRCVSLKVRDKTPNVVDVSRCDRCEYDRKTRQCVRESFWDAERVTITVAVTPWISTQTVQRFCCSMSGSCFCAWRFLSLTFEVSALG